MVALSFASTQLGPCLLENFFRDRGNQVVLGTFVSTFLYCLLVLLTIRGADSQAFVPEISVTFGIAPALMSIGVLIYFFHHVSPSCCYDETGKLRLITSSFSFEGVLDTAFDQIRQTAASNVSVTIRLLETLAAIAGVVGRPERKEAIRPQADMIKRAGDRFITEKLDHKDIMHRYRSLKKILDAG